MSKITKESLLSYDEKRLLIFTSTCVGIALIIGFIIGYLIPPSESKINNQATIQNFNKAHYNMLDAAVFGEYSDEAKINFITGYEQGFQQGREHEISKYNQIQSKKQEEIENKRLLDIINNNTKNN